MSVLLRLPPALIVVAILLRSSASAQAEDPTPAGAFVLQDAQYRNACGPIACYIAARRAGWGGSLDLIANSCTWSEGKECTLQELTEGLAATDCVDLMACRAAPRDLVNHLRTPGATAILVVRKSTDLPNHAVCVIAFADEKFVLADYPDIRQRMSEDQLATIWDGPALLVRPRSHWTPGAAICIACVWGVAVAVILWGKRQNSHRVSNAS